MSFVRRLGSSSLVAALRLAFVAGWGVLLASAAASLVMGVAPAIAVLLTKLIIDGVARGTDYRALIVLVVALSATSVVLVAVPNTVTYLQAQLARRVDVVLQDTLYGAIHGLDGLACLETSSFRDRLQMAQQCSGQTLAPATSGLFVVLQYGVTITTVTAVLAAISPFMAVALLASSIPALLAELSISRKRVRLLAELSPSVRRRWFYALLLVDLRAAKEARLLGLQARFRSRMSRELTLINDEQGRLDRRELSIQTILAVSSTAVTAIGLALIIANASAGRLTVGDVSLFIGAVAAVQGPAASLVRQISQAYEALSLFGRFREVLATPNDLSESGQSCVLSTLLHKIELQDVWFRYRDDLPWVLSGVSMTIHRGSTVALVGLNGSGKSTLVKLLCRFYDPNRGRILWDGVDLRDVTVTSLRENIGVLFQDFMTYDLTAADNIGLGDVSRIDDRGTVTAAAERAGAHHAIVALRDGYDTMLSLTFSSSTRGRDDASDGQMLSGGQWQRVALARTLMRKTCSVMILDEPSAGLDAEAEHSINASLRETRSGRTTVVISHRLGSIRDSDVIVVIEDGGIVEAGDHARLMSNAGPYARLFELQAQGYNAMNSDEFAAYCVASEMAGPGEVARGGSGARGR